MFLAEGDGWRCTGCHRFRSDVTAARQEQCTPIAVGARRAIERAPALGHNLYATRAIGTTGLGFVFCVRCGRFAGAKLSKLTMPCRPPTHGGKLALQRLGRSPPVHPDVRKIAVQVETPWSVERGETRGFIDALPVEFHRPKQNAVTRTRKKPRRERCRSEAVTLAIADRRDRTAAAAAEAEEADFAEQCARLEADEAAFAEAATPSSTLRKLSAEMSAKVAANRRAAKSRKIEKQCPWQAHLRADAERRRAAEAAVLSEWSACFRESNASRVAAGIANDASPSTSVPAAASSDDAGPPTSVPVAGTAGDASPSPLGSSR